MVMITLIRHGQASFGSKNYDKLTPLGRDQAFALGQAMQRDGVIPTTLACGSMHRHAETLTALCDGLGLAQTDPVVLPGLNEFDFRGLLDARYSGTPAPKGVHSDRSVHFRALRETVLAWQRDEISDPPERFADFAARVSAAGAQLQAMAPVLAVSSGGPISWLVTQTLEAPDHLMIRLQLQMRNCAVSRLRTGTSARYLDAFNHLPHVTGATTHLETFS